MASVEEKEEMDSLFEGMVLFNPSQISDDDHHPTPPSPPTKSASPSPPLDENLFSDLTLVAPIQTLDLQLQSVPSPTTTTREIPSFSRQISRKKKRAGLRIGYGRDAPLPDDEPPLHHSDANPQPLRLESPLPLSAVRIEGASESKLLGDTSVPVEEEASSLTPDTNSRTICPVSLRELANPPTMTAKSGILNSDLKGNDSSTTSVSNDALRDDDLALGPEPSVSPKDPEAEEEEQEADRLTEENLEHIWARISEKLDHIRELAASVSGMRKDSARMRRKATENVNLTSIRYKKLEKELEGACEDEDFEKAERVSESLAAAEKEKESFVNALKDAEAECDAFDLKMQEVFELQIAAEEEGVSLLERFAKDATNTADLVLKNAEVLSSKEMDEWLSSSEALELKKMELEIESHLINDTRLGLNDSIEHSIEDDRREKELLCKKQFVLTEELEKLLALVREKEAEIAENDSNIQAIEKRISDVVFGLHDVQSSINTKYDNVQLALSRMESVSEALSTKKKEVEDFLSQEELRVVKLRELASVSADEAKACQELVGLRKSLALSILKSREDKVRLAKTEERIMEDFQMLRQDVSDARASLQELSSTKSSIHQEIASSKQRIFFIDKRGPELEAEKKVAAAARNFKEAARIAAEAKVLSVEKEGIQTKMEVAILELGKIEEEIKNTVSRLHEIEGLIFSKEKEAALARCERQRLIAAAAMAERSAALELGELEEASVLLAEAEAADSEAKQLQQAYNFKEDEFGNLPKHFISLEIIINLEGKQLAEMAASVYLSASS
ncbi:hypothetical protein HHK36_002350 [Tetracentron sinense]|uniref:UVR domain-containing protein n=1 Tax=Tetracentron sinense TaxID=13715 RepID=A0A835DRG2_TETSI|nr:hypothetical protein HHK36_002350 [Tetracentron sinense]